MATNNYFSHTGSVGSGLEDRAADNGFYTFPLGENIAAGYVSIQAVVLAWMLVRFSPDSFERMRENCGLSVDDRHALMS